MMQYALQKFLVLPGYDLIKLVVCSLGKIWKTAVAVWYGKTAINDIYCLKLMIFIVVLLCMVNINCLL